MVDTTLDAAALGVVLLLDVLALIALHRGSGTRQHKLGWSLAILLLPVVGVAAYLLVGHRWPDAHLPP